MELDELGIDIEAQNCLDQIQQESRTSADYDPSQGMTGEELHNFCKFLYSQIQSKDEEISRLTANINPHCSHPSCNSLISNIQIF